MILEALVDQIAQRFQYEKRAQVCLWFDERQEMARLLPALHAHLESRGGLPFRLLEYDAARHRGQIWLKHQIHQALEAAEPAVRRSLRFVLYLPFAESRLEGPGPDGEPALDLLAEYRFNGVTWRIGGKRPTLFAFLRQSGVALPENASEQRALYEGGRDSLLAKYVAKFADRPRDFWQTTLTPEQAQARLVGDADQMLFELAIDPDAAWKGLRERGLDRELVTLVQARYGFAELKGTPAEWIEEIVATVALTETYLGYGEPEDFPFAARLPPVALRPHHVQLLQRWLRDAQSRAAWDRWIERVEARFDLTTWARGREGLAFGFPHLVRLRWQEVAAAFEAAAPKETTTAAFFARYGDLVSREAELSRTSYSPVGAWDLLRNLRELVAACEEGRRLAERARDISALARVYTDHARSIEGRHLSIRAEAEEKGFPTAARVADRAYAAYAHALSTRAFERFVEAGSTEIPGIAAVGARLKDAIWKARGRRAVVIVDALRYDCALAIQDLLREQDTDVEPLMATLPTVTPIGMTALLPAEGEITVEVKGNTLHPILGGKDLSVRANRLAVLAGFGADCRDIGDVEASSETPADLGELLVVFGHDEVDRLGHGDGQALVRHVQLEVDRLARLIRKLHRWGYPVVHVVTDHGFILLDEERLPEEVPCDKSWCRVYKERFALVDARADLPLASFPFPWNEALRVAVPPGLAFFKAEKSFSHGGATLQELVIPHLVSRCQVTREKRVGIEVVLPTYELMRTAVKVVVRPISQAPAQGQLQLFAETGRTLLVDVRRSGSGRASVLDSGSKEIRLEPKEGEKSVTLFFRTAEAFEKGELLELEIRDVETGEPFPPGGIKLTVGRDM
ncbi:MAG TPA: PglZ domain-containing protein [Thermoanaerobaculia bacterium]|jgi:hypothetical protein